MLPVGMPVVGPVHQPVSGRECPKPCRGFCFAATVGHLAPGMGVSIVCLDSKHFC